MARQSSGVGQGGKSHQDREVAARVRSLALGEIEKILLGKGIYKEDTEFRKQVILRMSTSLLPRLNAGRDENERLFPSSVKDMSDEQLETIAKGGTAGVGS